MGGDEYDVSATDALHFAGTHLVTAKKNRWGAPVNCPAGYTVVGPSSAPCSLASTDMRGPRASVYTASTLPTTPPLQVKAC